MSVATENLPQTSDHQQLRLSWQRLCRLEPRLAALYRKAKSIRDDKRKPSFCANVVWKGYDQQDGGLQHELHELVGYGAPDDADPRLRTSAAWRMAHHMIYGALPDCRNCVCVAFDAIVQGRLGR